MVKWDPKTIQSHLPERIKIAQLVNSIISTYFTHSTDCTQTWKKLFKESFVATRNFLSQGKEATRLGGGTYGTVYRVHLLKAPEVVMAMKRSKEIELAEAKRTVVTSALAEVGINPHFQILYAHFHCASMQKTPEPGKYLTWKEAGHQLESLVKRYEYITQRLKAYPKVSNKNRMDLKVLEADRSRIEEKIKFLFANIYPTLEEERYWLQKKRDLEQARVNSMALSESPTQLDNSIYKDVTLSYRKIIALRAQHTKPFELMALEYGDGSLEDLRNRQLSDIQAVSMVFQTFVAILSLQAYGDMVHNDLAPRNVLYNAVHATTTFCYQVGEVSFRVPLGGYLCKIIDFGLTTNTKSYLIYAKHRWCPGGSRRGGNPDGKTIHCVPHLRDFIEFLFEFKKSMHTLSSRVTRWLAALLYTVKRLNVGTWQPGMPEKDYNHAEGRKVAIHFVQEAFTKALVTARFEFSFQTPRESEEPLYKVTDATRRDEVRAQGLKKLWYENINPEKEG